MTPPDVPEKYRPAPQLVRGEWVLCQRPPSPPHWRLAWWAGAECTPVLSRRTGISARMATPDRVITSPWLEPQATPEAAMVLLVAEHGLCHDTPMPEIEEAPRSMEELENLSDSKRLRSILSYTG